MGGMTALMVVCITYPFLPGSYDGLAMPLSTLAQALGVLGTLLIVPVGVLWLVSEQREHARRKQHLPAGTGGYAFALASLIASSVVVAVASLGVSTTFGISTGLLALALWLFVVARLVPGLKRLRAAERRTFNPAPLYLVLIPVAVLLVQLTIATRATERSRNRAIAHAGPLIDDIEQYRARHGRYPAALSAVHQDYDPSLVGIDRFRYAPRHDGYDLFFEQPRFLLDDIGAREFVVYNRRDQHVVISHDAWILSLAPDVLEANQGWYAVRDAGRPHWKYFLFD
jgi:hypothetical protein